ncbi:MAG: Xaa-Pro peptidase family protein [Gemmatimonadetes bacterium]|nr:Xaa-Pro peptidase family protein [Gemmatimonadota bacterium]
MPKGAEPLPSRLASVRAELAAGGIDALLVTSAANTRYLTGFSGSNSLLVVSHDRAVLLTDFRYRTQASTEVASVVEVEIEGTSLWTRLWSVLRGLSGAKQLAFESTHLLHSDYQRLTDAGARWSWRPTSGIVEALRQRKDPTELAHIRRSVAVAESALAQTLPEIRAGVTELEVGARLEAALREHGSKAHPFETIIASGERAALPHARCSARELKSGDLLIVDFGATTAGYCSDITRTFVVGRASDQQRDAYDIVREANASASAGVRAGMRGRDADAIARDYIERQGLGPEFGHSLGHGIGLEVHEAPRLSKTSDAVLTAGAVVTIEPGIYREGWGGVRIEDDVFLGPDGPEVLTTFPRGLMELGAA